MKSLKWVAGLGQAMRAREQAHAALALASTVDPAEAHGMLFRISRGPAPRAPSANGFGVPQPAADHPSPAPVPRAENVTPPARNAPQKSAIEVGEIVWY